MKFKVIAGSQIWNSRSHETLGLCLDSVFSQIALPSSGNTMLWSSDKQHGFGVRHIWGFVIAVPSR